MRPLTDDRNTATDIETLNIEAGWRQWQTVYAIKRKTEFLRIIDAMVKRVPFSR